MDNTFAKLAKDFASFVEGASKFEETAKRRDYWRQRTGEARELVRDIDTQIDDALETLNTLKRTIGEQRKHWVGPKMPPKVYQAPHSSK